MMKINVSHIAKLANLKLSSEEIKKFERQLSSVVDYISQLNTVDTSGVEATSQVNGLENISRKDSPVPSLSQEEVLKDTKSKHNGLFKVKAIFEG